MTVTVTVIWSTQCTLQKMTKDVLLIETLQTTMGEAVERVVCLQRTPLVDSWLKSKSEGGLRVEQ